MVKLVCVSVSLTCLHYATARLDQLLSLCLCLSVSLSPVCLSVSLSLCLFVSVSLCLSLSHTLFLSLSFSLSLFYSLSFTLSHSLFYLSLSLFLSLSLSCQQRNKMQEGHRSTLTWIWCTYNFLHYLRDGQIQISSFMWDRTVCLKSVCVRAPVSPKS